MKRILLNWYYYRHDLTSFLLEQLSDHELIFIDKQEPDEEPDYVTGKERITVDYWGRYTTPAQLLDAVRPDVIVFSDLQTFNQIALNMVARSRGIPTFVLQHGLRGDFEIDLAVSAAAQAGPQKIQFSNTSLWSLRFLAAALRPKHLFALPTLLRFIYDRKRYDLQTALYKHQFELRRADYYIEFSDSNATYHKKRDGVPDNRFRIVGNPGFDSYFSYLNEHAQEDRGYALLIDCPFVELRFTPDHGVDAAKKNEYLRRLDEWSRVNGLPLRVKLHPYSYGAKDLYSSDNISYDRDADLRELIAGARVVYFVHFSSLAPVIMAYKPCVYFSGALPDHDKAMRALSLPELPLFAFDTSRANLAETARPASSEAVLPFLHSVDGKAGQRVRDVLLSS